MTILQDKNADSLDCSVGVKESEKVNNENENENENENGSVENLNKLDSPSGLHHRLQVKPSETKIEDSHKFIIPHRIPHGIPHGTSGASTDEASISAAISLLRRFHLGDPEAAKKSEKVYDGLLPALLNPYREISRFRYEYPLYLHPAQGGEEVEDGCLVQPVIDFLPAAIEIFAPQAESSRLLKDNLPWLENNVFEQLAKCKGPVDARPLVTKAGKALQKHLGFSEGNRELLQKDLDQLENSFAEGSQLLAYGPNVAIYLLRHAIINRLYLKGQDFNRRLQEQIRGLNQLLAVEREKSLSGKDTKEVQDRVGEASRYFDPSALSGVLEQRSHGSVSMTDDQIKRITEVRDLLESYCEEPDPIRFVVEPGSSWSKQLSDFDLIEDADPCTKGLEIYEEEAARCARIFSASRMAQLEIEGKYDAGVHDSWFKNFDWEAFSPEELHLIPTVVVLESAERIASEGLKSFSRLLNSGKPVQILTWVHAHSNPGADSGEDPLRSFRLELAYFGIGHRQAIVNQASASRHDQLMSGFTTALNSTRTGLHLINTGYRDKSKTWPLDPWIMSSAALESRAHPFIQVNPQDTGNSQAHTNFAGNPHPDCNWSTQAFSYTDETGETIETEFSFTFADYCLLYPELREHFRVMPVGCDDEDLVSVDDYLAASSEVLDRAIPFIWAVDKDEVLQKLVVSRGLILACRDRQNYWRTLQALTGVRNEHIDTGIEIVREEERVIAASEREKLISEHALELEKVRTETAGEVMGQLTNVLLDLDLTGLASKPASKPVSETGVDTEEEEIVTQSESEQEPEAESADEDEDEISFDEPWIDSIFCTTCDDCMAINKQLFVYNENKQAILTDPKTGTFAQLVAAAELCPAKCIHPGKPLNPSEPDLDDLIKRAEPFN